MIGNDVIYAYCLTGNYFKRGDNQPIASNFIFLGAEHWVLRLPSVSLGTRYQRLECDTGVKLAGNSHTVHVK
jgi:hypothetical protein